MTRKKTDLIAIIKKAMEADGMSVEQLAAASGVGRDALYRWLAGKQDLRTNNLQKLLNALRLSLLPSQQQQQ